MANKISVQTEISISLAGEKDPEEFQRIGFLLTDGQFTRQRDQLVLNDNFRKINRGVVIVQRRFKLLPDRFRIDKATMVKISRDK